MFVDYTKYQQRAHRRARQLSNDTVSDINVTEPSFAGRNDPNYSDYPQHNNHPQNNFQHPQSSHYHLQQVHSPHHICADPVNEVYQECGSKCVLGCRYTTLSAGITISKHDCEKNDCVEGCFCKTGLVRHQTKCIPASECPIRKCHHRDEVYMCGAAAPITCMYFNTFRFEILK